MVKRLVTVMVFAAILIGIAGCSGGDSFPTKSIEVVVPYGAGGGSDIFARTFAKVLNEKGIVEQPFTVVNKSGASGAVGMTYVQQKKADPYYLMPIGFAILTAPIKGEVEFSYKDFTPIACLGFDQWLIFVPAESPIQTMDDLIAAAVAKPDEVTIGGTGLGGSEHIMVNLIQKATGAKFNYIPFQGGAEVTTACAGSHVEAAVSNVSEAYPLVEAGAVRAIAVSGNARVSKLPDTPTLKETEINVEFAMPRGVYAAGDIPEEAVTFMIDAFEEMSKAPEWTTEYLEKNMITPALLTGDDFAEYLDEQSQVLETEMKELGVIE